MGEKANEALEGKWAGTRQLQLKAETYVNSDVVVAPSRF
jgi:hypothetical protein